MWRRRFRRWLTNVLGIRTGRVIRGEGEEREGGRPGRCSMLEALPTHVRRPRRELIDEAGLDGMGVAAGSLL